MITWPPPEIPEWAKETGCPTPNEGEGFKEYVERLGLNFDDLTIDLDQQTAVLANYRLSKELRARNPESFSRYVSEKTRTF